MMKNNRGLSQIILIPLIIISIVSILALVFGIGSAIKIQSIINSIPTWAWILIGLLLIILIIPKK